MKKIIITLLCIISASVIGADISVTVYNNNLGVISESRSFDFNKGESRLEVKDIPSQIDVGSVRFELTESGKNISILEQNYAYDLVSNNKMYAKYIDKEIEIIGKEGQLYSGTLLSQSGGTVTLQEDTGRIKLIQLNNIAEVNFPALPDGLITRPTLFWKYISDFNGQAKGNLSYQTTGMSWKAEYVGLLSSDEKAIDLSGWASINNNSGKTYKDASLKLIAGDINRVSDRRGGRDMMMKTAMMEVDRYSGFEEKSFFEYHMYSLPRKATLANNESKQITLFEPASTNVNKVYIYRPERNQSKVEVVIKFKNSNKTGLGMPLPAGRVRIFKADDDGALILLGEDRIDHTPKDEEIKLTVGNAFDITAESQLLSQKQITAKVREMEFEIKINNRKDEKVTIEIEKKLYGYWEIFESSLTYEKKNANTVIFNLPIEANSTGNIKFNVRYNLR